MGASSTGGPCSIPSRSDMSDRELLRLREGCVVDLHRHVVQFDDQERVLTSREVALLQYLGARPGQTISMEEIHREVFGYAPAVQSRAAFHAVQRLRRKLEPDPAAPQHLITVYGTGYRLMVDPSEAAPCLFGRQTELAWLRRASRLARLVTVTGLGGIGKTALVRAARLGGPWVQLGRQGLPDPSRALGAVFGIELTSDDPVGQVGRALSAYGPLTVVLDEVEGVQEELAACLARWLERAPRVHFVLTSRTPLSLYGEQVLALDPLPVPAPSAPPEEMAASPAVQLFLSRAPGRKGEAAALVRQLEGYPLAIELAAACSPEVALPTLRGSPHDAVRTAIEWSWSTLSPPAREALAQVSVFAAPFLLEAAEQVLELPRGTWVADVLQELVDRSLLQRLGARFWALEPVRRFAAAHLAPREPVEVRHGALYARLPSESGLAPLEDLADAEVACRRALARGRHDVAVATACAVAHRLGYSGPYTAAIALLHEVVEHTGDLRCEMQLARLLGLVGDPAARSRIEGVLARAEEPALRARAMLTALWLRPPPPETRAQLEEALALFQRLGDWGRQAQTMAALARLEQREGRLSSATALSLRALDLHRRTGSRLGEAVLLSQLGRLEMAQSNFDTAAGWFERALGLYQELGTSVAEGTTLGDLAHLAQKRGQSAEAAELYERALGLHRQSGYVQLQARMLVNCSALHHEAGRLEETERCLQEALSMIRQEGDPQGELPVALAHLAELRRAQGHLPQAMALLEEVLALHRAAGTVSSVGIALGNLAALCAETGELERVVPLLQEALALHRQVGNRFYEALDLVNLGEHHLLQGRPEQARPLVEAGLAIAQKIGARRIEGHALGVMAALSRAQGRPREARELLEEGQAVLHEVGDRVSETRTLVELAELELESGRLPEAEQTLVRAERLGGAAGGPSLRALLACCRARLSFARGETQAAQAALGVARAQGVDERSRVGRQIAGLERRASS
jgi:tetratricopeptide (TPR) repeat protein/DNA-binding winged helix-turn-helix (wHTH) protein